MERARFLVKGKPVYVLNVKAWQHKDFMVCRAVFEQRSGQKTERLEFEGDSRLLLTVFEKRSHAERVEAMLRFVLLLVETRQDEFDLTE